jgi:elongator complex protein 2
VCVVPSPGGEREHRLVSCSEEKVLRVLDATQVAASALECVASVAPAECERFLTAYAPELGLSAKGVTTEMYEQLRRGSARSTVAVTALTVPSVEPVEAPPAEERLLDGTLFSESQKLYAHVDEVIAVACSLDGRLVASSSKARDESQAVIRLWDATTWQEVAQLAGHSNSVVQLRFSSDSARLASVGRDRMLCIFRVEPAYLPEPGSRQLVCNAALAIRNAHKRIIWACSFSHDDSLLASGSRDGVVKLWQVHQLDAIASGDSSVKLQVFELPPLHESVTALAFSPAGARAPLLAIGFDSGAIQLWDVADPCRPSKHRQQLPRSLWHCGTVRRLAWRPGRDLQLLSCGVDWLVQLVQFEESEDGPAA